MRQVTPAREVRSGVNDELNRQFVSELLQFLLNSPTNPKHGVQRKDEITSPITQINIGEALAQEMILAQLHLQNAQLQPVKEPQNDSRNGVLGFRAPPLPSGLNTIGYRRLPGSSSDVSGLAHDLATGIVSPPGLTTAESEVHAPACARKPEREHVSKDSETKEGQRNPEMQHARDLAQAGGGLSGHTTVMIQQIPYQYTQTELTIEINNNGFDGTYDFFFLPMSQKRHGNLGFGFVNFLTPSFAEQFYRKYQGQKMECFDSTTTINVIPADVQGFEQSAAHFYSSWHLRKRKRLSVPLFLKPVPAHVREAGWRKGMSRPRDAYEGSSSSQDSPDRKSVV